MELIMRWLCTYYVVHYEVLLDRLWSSICVARLPRHLHRLAGLNLPAELVHQRAKRMPVSLLLHCQAVRPNRQQQPPTVVDLMLAVCVPYHFELDCGAQLPHPVDRLPVRQNYRLRIRVITVLHRHCIHPPPLDLLERIRELDRSRKITHVLHTLKLAPHRRAVQRLVAHERARR